MKTSHLALLLTALLALLLIPPATAQDQRYLCYGTITWNSSQTPAASITVRLLKEGKEITTVYTDPQGSFNFTDTGNPADYTIEIHYRGKPLKTLKPDDLKATPRGTRLDIKLD